ncbi:MAG: hypothetical protein DWH91_12700, partial [Planctomycetota bacterium]
MSTAGKIAYPTTNFPDAQTPDAQTVGKLTPTLPTNMGTGQACKSHATPGGGRKQPLHKTAFPGYLNSRRL